VGTTAGVIKPTVGATATVAHKSGCKASAKDRVTTASLKNSKRARCATRVVTTSVRTRIRPATQSAMAIARDIKPTVGTTAGVIKPTVGATATVAHKSGCKASAKEPAACAKVLRPRRRTLTNWRSTLMKMEITRSLAVDSIRNVARTLFPVE